MLLQINSIKPIAFLIFITGSICGSPPVNNRCLLTKSGDYQIIGNESRAPDIPSGSNVTIKCNKNFRNTNKPNTFTFSCKNGQWLPTNQKCLSKYLPNKSN